MQTFTKRFVQKMFLSESRINCKNKPTSRIHFRRDLFLFSLNEQGRFYLKCACSFKIYLISLNSTQILTIGIIKCELVHLWNFRTYYVSLYYTLGQFHCTFLFFNCTFQIQLFLLHIMYLEL